MVLEVTKNKKYYVIFPTFTTFSLTVSSPMKITEYIH